MIHRRDFIVMSTGDRWDAGHFTIHSDREEAAFCALNVRGDLFQRDTVDGIVKMFRWDHDNVVKDATEYSIKTGMDVPEVAA